MSVLYHALEAAHTCREYRQDAEPEGDQQLIEFFDEVISRNREIADRAKECLADRLSQSEQRAAQSEQRPGTSH